MQIQAPKGTQDILPKDVYKWQYVEKIIKQACENFAYGEIRFPVFEHTELFLRGVGETSDVVQKEMYTFEDKGGRSITLRPEGTASVVRSYIQNSLYSAAQPTKLYYIISSFRYEKPQAGRWREFFQFGAEVLGASDPAIDCEVIALSDIIIKKLGIKNVQLHINSIGCPVCRAEYNRHLMEFLSGKKSELCHTCLGRFDKNPMRILDCKNEKCRELVSGAPVMIDYLCGECESHFSKFKKNLNVIGVDFVVNPSIVRGLDYYTKTVFEFICNDVGAQSAICAGGRYDGLVQELGGVKTPALGFGMGISRILYLIGKQNIEIPLPPTVGLYIVSIGEVAAQKGMEMVYQLCQKDVSAQTDYVGRSVKAQMKYADKIGARYTLVIGESELDSGVATLKNMGDGSERSVNLSDIDGVVKIIQERV